LTQVQSLVSESANTGSESSDETSANQLQVDSILDTINKIAGSTTFDGKQLLNGNLDYATSGAATSAFGSVQINTAQLADNSTMRVSVKVVNSATTGQVSFAGTDAGAHAYIGASAVTLQVAGSVGTQAVSVAGSSTISSVATAINQLSSQTGVSATTSGGHLYMSANQYGSANFVSVQATSGTFTIAGGTNGKDTGKDSVVTVNGATTTTAGTNVSYHTGTLDVDLSLTTAMNKGQTKVFTITGGGATFQLDGQVDEGGKASIGIQSVNTASLGSAATGYLASLGTGGSNSMSSGNFTQAQQILTAAVSQVSDLRGRLGAFQTYTLGSTIDNLNVASENAASAESAIEDTDFASETANLTRDQILVSASQTVLAQANSRPQSVLTLLQSA
jgi:flagellin